MLVDLKQYKHEEVDFDDNRTTGRSQTEEGVEKGTEEYFGEDVETFHAESWETVQYEGDPIQQRYVTIDGVTAVSVPEQPTDEDDPDLPGRTIQFRMGGGIDYLEQAEIVEVEDRNPQEPEAEGKVSVEDDAAGG